MNNSNLSIRQLLRGKDSNLIPFVDQTEIDNCKSRDNEIKQNKENEELDLSKNYENNHFNNKDLIGTNNSETLQSLKKLRRNSISLPQIYPSLLQLNELNENQNNCNIENSNLFISNCIESISEPEISQIKHDVKRLECNNVPEIKIESDTDDDSLLDESRPVFQNKFRNKRRLSIAPLPALRLNNKAMLSNDYDNESHQNSITSVNSIASLLKEKMQAFPQMIRRKKKETKDYKIKIFVIILFFIISFLIGYSYIMYHRKILTKSYFEKAKFNEVKRILRLFNENDKEIIVGVLGTMIGNSKKPYGCLEDHTLVDGSVCLEWNDLSRLYMSFESFDHHRCYSIKWQSLNDKVHPTDCYDMARDESHWFGGSITKNLDWPLNRGNFDFSPLISGDAKIHQFGNAIKRYFINSLGVAILVDEKTPLHIAMNKTAQQFCIRAMNDDFAFVNRLTPLPELAYKICTGKDMKTLHQKMIQQHLWDGVTEAQKKIRNSLIEEPIWKIPFKNGSFNETAIYSYSEKVIGMGFMRLGHILLNEFWQENIGDFSIDKNRFPTLKNIVDVLHRRGFKISLTILPFISTDSINFKEAVRNKLLIYERHSEKSIPALTRYKSSSAAGALDITNNASIPWLYNKLKKVMQDYQIDNFYMDEGIAYNMPYYYQCFRTLINPDEYSKIISNNFKQMVDFIGTSTASSVLRPPTFLSLPPLNSTWHSLKELLVSVLTYGILGYPFLLPGSVGGDYYLRNQTPKMISFYLLEQPPLPPQELYVRWLQLVTFLPAVQFTYLPSEYNSEPVMEIAKELTAIRQKTVIPLLKKYLDQSMDDGLPLIRPLWMVDSNDPACLSLYDEFSVGDELIVAPILEENVHAREVYLPQGVWKDGVDGSLRKGSRWLHNYRVPKDKIAYFVKMPDNTRF